MNLQNTLNVDEWYKKGNSLIQKLIPYLTASSKFNDIVGEIGNRDNIITISKYIFKHLEVITMYESLGKDFLSPYGVSEENIPQIKLKYEQMSESFKEIVANLEQNVAQRVNDFWNMYNDGVIWLNNDSDENKERLLYISKDTDKSKFSGRDVGEATYDADTTLCVEADRIIQEIQRSDIENGHRK